MLLFIRELEMFSRGAGELLRTLSVLTEYLGSVPSVLQPSRTPIPGTQCLCWPVLALHIHSTHEGKIKNNLKNKLHNLIQKILSVGIWTHALLMEVQSSLSPSEHGN